jgi:hypothetical protein
MVAAVTETPPSRSGPGGVRDPRPGEGLVRCWRADGVRAEDATRNVPSAACVGRNPICSGIRTGRRSSRRSLRDDQAWSRPGNGCETMAITNDSHFPAIARGRSCRTSPTDDHRAPTSVPAITRRPDRRRDGGTSSGFLPVTRSMSVCRSSRPGALTSSLRRSGWPTAAAYQREAPAAPFRCDRDANRDSVRARRLLPATWRWAAAPSGVIPGRKRRWCPVQRTQRSRLHGQPRHAAAGGMGR